MASYPTNQPFMPAFLRRVQPLYTSSCYRRRIPRGFEECACIRNQNQCHDPRIPRDDRIGLQCCGNGKNCCPASDCSYNPLSWDLPVEGVERAKQVRHNKTKSHSKKTSHVVVSKHESKKAEVLREQSSTCGSNCSCKTHTTTVKLSHSCNGADCSCDHSKEKNQGMENNQAPSCGTHCSCKTHDTNSHDVSISQYVHNKSSSSNHNYEECDTSNSLSGHCEHRKNCSCKTHDTNSHDVSISQSSKVHSKSFSSHHDNNECDSTNSSSSHSEHGDNCSCKTHESSSESQVPEQTKK